MRRLLERHEYSFAPLSQKVIFHLPVTLPQVLLITNLADQVLIYQFNHQGKGGTLVGQELTLEYNTTSMEPSDHLQVFFEPLDDPTEKLLKDILIVLKETRELLRDMREALLALH